MRLCFINCLTNDPVRLLRAVVIKINWKLCDIIYGNTAAICLVNLNILVDIVLKKYLAKKIYVIYLWLSCLLDLLSSLPYLSCCLVSTHLSRRLVHLSSARPVRFLQSLPLSSSPSWPAWRFVFTVLCLSVPRLLLYSSQACSSLLTCPALTVPTQSISPLLTCSVIV